LSVAGADPYEAGSSVSGDTVWRYQGASGGARMLCLCSILFAATQIGAGRIVGVPSVLVRV
jgi:hypothetical protein